MQNAHKTQEAKKKKRAMQLTAFTIVLHRVGRGARLGTYCCCCCCSVDIHNASHGKPAIRVLSSHVMLLCDGFSDTTDCLLASLFIPPPDRRVCK